MDVFKTFLRPEIEIAAKTLKQAFTWQSPLNTTSIKLSTLPLPGQISPREFFINSCRYLKMTSLTPMIAHYFHLLFLIERHRATVNYT